MAQASNEFGAAPHGFGTKRVSADLWTVRTAHAAEQYEAARAEGVPSISDALYLAAARALASSVPAAPTQQFEDDLIALTGVCFAALNLIQGTKNE